MIVYNAEERISVDVIDRRDTMYPSYALMARKKVIVQHEYIGWATMMGFCLGEATVQVGETRYKLKQNQYFSFPVKCQDVLIEPEGDIFVVFRLGFLGHDLIGTQDITKQGRLSYIDGCSDSLMVYPPRLGDPTLNYLYFPTNIMQSFHTHPSIRIGCVIDGEGVSDTCKSTPLKVGTFFCLDEHEYHRFKTESSSMRVIAYHPDGDWGPTDENHTMLNRTYIKK
jgi:hypothetical protein